MSKAGSSIGVFDSGIGGLSILSAIRKLLPQYSYIYLADNANTPYGDKTAEEIYVLTKKSVEILFEKGCILVILACNSASACALRRLQQEWLPIHYPDRKVLGILVPTIEQVTTDTYKSLGILATKATIASGAYEREIKKRAPDMKLIEQACPGLVDLIEEGAPDEEIKEKAAVFVSMLLKKSDHPPDAILLGCTHYS
ncbi:MAG: glutamate racemase, partial [Candidatus Andersenbacteria bacterium]|nr:glutamate racemase [Candidatus Andersenbacteria bacterium]